jgi:predicted PurR-regulated permease PerM
VTDPEGEPQAPVAVRVLDLDWRSVVVALAAVVVLVALAALIRAIPRTATWFTIGALLALALNPLVGGVQRRMHARRGIAVALVVAGFIAAVTLIALVLGPPAVRQANQLSDQLPEVAEDLGNLPLIGERLRDNDVPQKIQDFVEDLPAKLSGDTAPIEGAARSILGGLLAGIATVLVTITLLLDGERLVRNSRRVVPHRYRERADRMGDLFYRIVGKYFAGSLLVAMIAGLAVLIVGLSLGVPLTPLLAVWVAVFDLVPQIGGAMGGIPFVLLAFTQGATVGVACGIFFLLYLQFENHILSPLVVGEAVDLSPPATMVAALVGVSAAGVPGALVAVPFMGVAKAIYMELRVPGGHEPKPRRALRIPGFLRRRHR